MDKQDTIKASEVLAIPSTDLPGCYTDSREDGAVDAWDAVRLLAKGECPVGRIDGDTVYCRVGGVRRVVVQG